ncbi:hypothetical protein RJ55_07317 [Drechmeria coniospora]|nr:hypothetical protein RJ55_07317 [Drechmeria coniospora]
MDDDDAAAASLPRPSPLPDAAPAICRICRGEGTAAEPLFYPCKCSGSIKHVHQDCLMEWLSHSQKKHCELCKTSFRFTKLYAPDMPQSLPVHVFLEHVARYLLRNLLLWLRAAVTVSVWVCWLPYFMRSVWSFMFWVSDEGLGPASVLARSDVAGAALWLSASDLGTCPATPLLAPTTTSAAEAAAVIKELHGEDLSEYLVRILLGSLGMPTKTRSDSVGGPFDASHASGLNLTVPTASTLLGDVRMLKNLTRSPTVNSTVVTVLEGQIITILVILSFILVILVRDYVVQQQPEINMRAAFEPENDDLPAPHADEPAEPPPPPPPLPMVEPLREPVDSDSDGEVPDGSTRASTPLPVMPAPESSTAESDMAGMGVGREQDGQEGPSTTATPVDEATSPPEMPSDRPAARRPFAVADADDADSRSSVMDYLRIYRRANGDLERILQIVEEEGLEDRLGYWVDVTRRSMTKRDDVENALALSLTVPSAAPEEHPRAAVEDRADELTALASASKGKEVAAAWPAPEQPRAASSRPRAASDGPRPRAAVHPLGSNNWSFADLPPRSSADEESPSFRADGASSVDRENGYPRDDEHHAHADTENGAVAAHPPEADQADQAEAPSHVEPQGLLGWMADFMWGGLDEHQNLDADDPHHDDDGWVDVPMADGPDDDVEPDDRDVDAVGGQGVDVEVIDDLEEFEGVMELIGMRGPIAGLFQNAIFCAVLVSVTIFACIFVPYNIGRLSVWTVANPLQLVRMLFELSKVVQDASIIVGGLASWCALNLVQMFTGVVGGALESKVVVARKASWALWTGAAKRVMECALMDFPTTASEMKNFSAISHEALVAVKGSLSSALGSAHLTLASLATVSLAASDGRLLLAAATGAAGSAAASLRALWSLLLDPSSWVIDLRGVEGRPPVDPELAYWSGLDRLWAILAGYVTICAVGAMYLRRGTPFSTGNLMQAWEAGVIDTLHQASGIMKVILIISIEMLVFPLYCGLLLDVALLPLFESITVRSRVMFTYNYPLTSIFVHWFVGTGYMFHFALFVSMCRKIMRPGVLYFIRDPDDPEFHPVRDVLERNLTTQLRKILFSAFVYGALVIVCLGGVVWGLAYALPGVLPIHYSSNEPVLEFPVDLLFYNFLMPLAVKVFKPGDGLHTMYTWWFRKCARALRLTYFLFGERRIDEEGTLQLDPGLRHRLRVRPLFLELDKFNQVIPKTWRDTFEGGHAKPNPPISSREERILRRRKKHLVGSRQLVKSGRFVRAPASDRVKIPKGRKVFLPVTELSRRKDGNEDNDIYASNQYQLVYIPPHFRTRVFLFILFIWLFAAVTGVGITVIPLALGRTMFKALIPEGIRTNDIYAFSIGIYLIGTVAYAVFRARSLVAQARGWVGAAWEEIKGGGVARRTLSAVVRAAKLLYAYFFLLLVFPLLFSTTMELYVTIPLHTYMNPPTAAREPERTVDRHTVRLIQAWTLGLLYLNLGTRMLRSLLPDSRISTAVRTVMRNGWLRPNIGVLTRAFVIPGVVMAAVATFYPPLMMSIFVRTELAADLYAAADEGVRAANLAILYRYSYPASALAAVVMRKLFRMVRVFNGWKVGIRDEAYLIGERLHNFGAAATGTKRAKKVWGAAGHARL